MNLYTSYVATKKNIADLEAKRDSLDDSTLNALADMKLSASILEEARPHYLDCYNRESKMQATFTKEQQDFICWQIGEWYIEWKERILVDLENGTHRLGFAKELLKEMICG